MKGLTAAVMSQMLDVLRQETIFTVSSSSVLDLVSSFFLRGVQVQ